MTPSYLGIAVVVGLAQMIPNLYFAVVLTTYKDAKAAVSHLNGVTRGQLLPVIPSLPVN